MAETASFWSYPGTWIAIVVAVVLLGGFGIMAVVLRRLLRKPPVQPALPPSPSIPSPKKPERHE